MNDAQKDAMLKALAKAFDKAAIHCSTSESAALNIVKTLKDNGFTITHLKKAAK
jgi:hypothetical protein